MGNIPKKEASVGGDDARRPLRPRERYEPALGPKHAEASDMLKKKATEKPDDNVKKKTFEGLIKPDTEPSRRRDVKISADRTDCITKRLTYTDNESRCKMEPKVIGNLRGKLERHTSSYETDPDDDTSPEKLTAKKAFKFFGSRKEINPKKSIKTPPLKDEPSTSALSQFNEIRPARLSPNSSRKLRRYLKTEHPLPRIESISDSTTPSPEDKLPCIVLETHDEEELSPISKKLITVPKNEIAIVSKASDNLMLPGDDRSKLDNKKKWLKGKDKSKKHSKGYGKRSYSDQDIPELKKRSTFKSWLPKSFTKLISNIAPTDSDANTIQPPKQKSQNKLSKLKQWASFYRRSDEGQIHCKDESSDSDCGHTSSGDDEYSDISVSAEDTNTTKVTINVIKDQDWYEGERFERPPSPCRWFVSDDCIMDPDPEPEVKMIHSPSTETVVAITSPSKLKKAGKLQSTKRSSIKQKEKKPLPKTAKERQEFFSNYRKEHNLRPPPRKHNVPFSKLIKMWRNFRKSKPPKLRSLSYEEVHNLIKESLFDMSLDDKFNLLSSLRTFLNEPPSITAKMELRSRSLNNLSNLLTFTSTFEDFDDETSPIRIKRSKLLSISNPDVSDNCYIDGLRYAPGYTKNRSLFIRYQNRLRHTNSQASQQAYFRVRLPDNFNQTKLFHKKQIKLKRNMLFIPAIGNTTLRRAIKNVLQDSLNLDGYVYAVYGTGRPLDLDKTDVGSLGGRLVMIQSKKSKKSFFGKTPTHGAKSSAGRGFFSKSADDSRGAGPSSTPSSSHGKDETKHMSKLNQLSAMFGGKSDTLRMEQLEAVLDSFAKYRVPLLSTFCPPALSRQSYDALRTIQITDIDKLMDMSKFTERQAARQRAIMEFLTTEASYICHLRTAVELFYSATYFLVKKGILNGVECKCIFSNIDEILNTNLLYWHNSLYPMIADALSRQAGFNTQLLYEGIMKFPECFKPYEVYVYEHKKCQNYSRHMMNVNAIYTAFLAWCESQKECMRLKLSDILVKPMQRLTKYSLLLKAIHDLTDVEPEISTLSKMHNQVKTYIANVNKSVRYRDECDATDEVIDKIEAYDIFNMKDEEIDREVRPYLSLNLHYSMVGCDPRQRRLLILQGDLRMKEWNEQRTEFHAVLLTDVFLICLPIKKKRSDEETYRVIRQKYMIERVRIYPKYSIKDGVEEMTSILFVILDETGTATAFFTIYESKSKEVQIKNPNLKAWEFALLDAKVTVDMSKKYFHHPRRTLLDIDSDSVSDFEADQRFSDQALQPDKKNRSVRKSAKERLLTMIHGAENMIPETENVDEPFRGLVSQNKSPYRSVSRGRSHGSSGGSRLSSLQHSHSGSYEMTESAPGPSRRLGSADNSIDRRTISMSSEEWANSLNHPGDPEDPYYKGLRPRSPSQRHGYRAMAPPTLTSNTLTVQPIQTQLGQSMPDLSSGDESPSNFVTIPIPQVSLNFPNDPNKAIYLRAGPSGAVLGPDNRGISYPPPSPTRASLRRGFAFSSTFKNPLVKSKQISREGSPISGSPKFEKSPLKAPPSSPYSIDTFNIPETGDIQDELTVQEAINIHTQSFQHLIPPVISPGTSEESSPVTEKRKI